MKNALQAQIEEKNRKKELEKERIRLEDLREEQRLK